MTYKGYYHHIICMYNDVILIRWCCASARCQIRRILSRSKNRSPPAKKQLYRDEQKPGTAGMVQVLSISWFFFIFLSMVVLMLYLSECRSWDPYQYPRIYWRADLCTDLCIEQKPQDHVIFQGCKKAGKSQALSILKDFLGSFETAGLSHCHWEGLGFPWHHDMAEFFGCL